MKEKLMQLIAESITLELSVADLYRIFQKAFPDDSAFWRKLALEEEHHASLIKDGRDFLLFRGEFPTELLAPKVKMLVEVNSKLASLLQEYSKNPPSRESAFNIALNVEQSAGEVHFQRAMENSSTSTIMRVFQILNKGDKDHARRIRTYMSDNGIEIRKNLMK
jgi:ferritin